VRIVLALAMIAACAPPPPPTKPPAPPPPPVPSEPSAPVGMPADYVEMKAWLDVPLGGQGALLLVDDPPAIVVPIFVGGTESVSIHGRLNGITPRRPYTHDLVDRMLRELHATIVQVQVDELRDDDDGNGVYIGSIFVRDAKKRVIRIDARPSDAIALAIGAHAPIYVARRVIEKSGVPYDEVQRQLGSAAANQPST
jgi:bifunctional DNase/RNase